jgi:hypothetical protein
MFFMRLAPARDSESKLQPVKVFGQWGSAIALGLAEILPSFLCLSQESIQRVVRYHPGWTPVTSTGVTEN